MKWKALLLTIAFAVQLAVPAWTIVDHERTIKNGEEFRFKVVPIDPYDAFRGRYVRINIDEPAAPYLGERTLQHGDTVYAYLEHNDIGLTSFREIALRPPEDDTPYLSVRYVGEYSSLNALDPDLNWVEVEIPIDRYYMEESMAPEAELAYRDAAGDDELWATVALRVLNGKSVLTGLFIGDQPIEAYLMDETRRSHS